MTCNGPLNGRLMRHPLIVVLASLLLGASVTGLPGYFVMQNRLTTVERFLPEVRELQREVDIIKTRQEISLSRQSIMEEKLDHVLDRIHVPR